MNGNIQEKWEVSKSKPDCDTDISAILKIVVNVVGQSGNTIGDDPIGQMVLETGPHIQGEIVPHCPATWYRMILQTLPINQMRAAIHPNDAESDPTADTKT